MRNERTTRRLSSSRRGTNMWSILAPILGVMFILLVGYILYYISIGKPAREFRAEMHEFTLRRDVASDADAQLTGTGVDELIPLANLPNAAAEIIFAISLRDLYEEGDGFTVKLVKDNCPPDGRSLEQTVKLSPFEKMDEIFHDLREDQVEEHLRLFNETINTWFKASGGNFHHNIGVAVDVSEGMDEAHRQFITETIRFHTGLSTGDTWAGSIVKLSDTEFEVINNLNQIGWEFQISKQLPKTTILTNTAIAYGLQKIAEYIQRQKKAGVSKLIWVSDGIENQNINFYELQTSGELERVLNPSNWANLTQTLFQGTPSFAGFTIYWYLGPKFKASAQKNRDLVFKLKAFWPAYLKALGAQEVIVDF